MPFSAPTRPAADSTLAALLREPAFGATRAQIPAKGSIYQPGDSADHIYYVHSGQVRTYQLGPSGTRRLIEILGADEWCGAAALARLPQYGELAEAVSPAVVSVVPVERLLNVLPQEPALALELIKTLANTLAAFREDAGGLVFEDCNHRLVRTLVHLSSSPAATVVEEGGVCVHITHQQLAQKVGVARETVSLALAQLRRKNLLRTGRNQLFFSPESLRQWTVQAVRLEAHAVPAGHGHDEPPVR